MKVHTHGWVTMVVLAALAVGALLILSIPSQGAVCAGEGTDCVEYPDSSLVTLYGQDTCAFYSLEGCHCIVNREQGCTFYLRGLCDDPNDFPDWP